MPPRRKSSQKGGSQSVYSAQKRSGGAIGPALKLASAAGAVSAMSSPQSHFYITYFFIFVILGLIVWILYMMKDRSADSTKKISDFQPAAVTTTGTLAYSAPPVPSSASTASSVEVPLTTIIMSPSSTPFGKRDAFQDPYEPPLKNDGMYFPPDSSDIRGIPLIGSMKEMLGFGNGPATCNSGLCATAPIVGGGAMGGGGAAPGWPVNMMTRGYAPEFSQIGILTHERGGSVNHDNSLHDNMILPLFGRRILNGRDKYQYYTLSNTGAVNTKLPVLVRNRNCINEYGCDEISSGDTVYVQGYNSMFKATVYENSLFSYIPFI